MPTPPPSSPPRSPPVTPTRRQPLDAVDAPSILPASPPRIADSSNPLSLAHHSPPLSGSASPPPPPPAPPSPELAFSNEQILSMMRPLVRVLQQRGVLDRLRPSPPAPPSPPKFPEPSVCTTTGTGTSGVPHTLTTKHDGFMAPSHYVAINMKTALQNKSLEELRLEDYNLAKATNPLPTAQNAPLAQPDQKPSTNAAPCAATFLFKHPPASPKPACSNPAPAANGFGPASKSFKLPWLSQPIPNSAPSFDLHPLFSPFSFPSSSQPTRQQPNMQTFANTNNSNTYATNWLSNDAPHTLPNPFKPHDGQSAFANSSKPFSFPPASQSASNHAASLFDPPPARNSFAPPSQLATNHDGNVAAASHSAANRGPHLLGSSGYSQTITQKQTYTTPAGENHGPVLNEIQMSQTAYFPQGWFC